MFFQLSVHLGKKNHSFKMSYSILQILEYCKIYNVIKQNEVNNSTTLIS